MDVQWTHPMPLQADSAADFGQDRRRLWFVLALPFVLACLVALVTVAGTAAAGPLLLVLVPLALWTAFRDTERALYVYLAWCWLDGIIRGLLSSDPVSIIARDIVLGVIVVGWGLQRLQNRHLDPVRVPPGTLLVALFVLNCVLQVFNPFAGSLVQSIGGLKMHLSALPLLFLGYDVLRRPAQLRALFLFLTLMTLINGAASYVQYVQGPSWTWAHFPGSKDAISQNLSTLRLGEVRGMTATFKPPGTTTGGGGAGAYIGMVFPLAFALPLLPGRLGFGRAARVCLVAVGLALLVFLFINEVRSALVSAVCGVLLSGVLIGGPLRLRMLSAVLVCLALGSIAYSFSQGVSQNGVTSRFATTFADPVDALHQDRRTFFDDAVFIAVHSPLGVGLGRVGGAGGRLGGGGTDPGFAVFSEAYLGAIMYETGIIGGLLIVGIALSLIGRGCVALRCLTEPDEQFLAAGTVAVLVIIFANFL